MRRRVRRVRGDKDDSCGRTSGSWISVWRATQGNIHIPLLSFLLCKSSQISGKCTLAICTLTHEISVLNGETFASSVPLPNHFCSTRPNHMTTENDWVFLRIYVWNSGFDVRQKSKQFIAACERQFISVSFSSSYNKWIVDSYSAKFSDSEYIFLFLSWLLLEKL